jgi:integrase
MDIADFREKHYDMVVADLISRCKTVMAMRLYADLSALMTYARKKKLIDRNYMEDIDKPYTYVPRDRHLSLKEIPLVWEGFDAMIATRDGTYTDTGPLILKLCLVTGQRIGEVVGMHRDELDLDPENPIWTIPKERTKNKREHVVPLSPLAVQIIRDALRLTNGNYVFPHLTHHDRPANYSFVHGLMHRAQQPQAGLPKGLFGVAPWRPHDLRRTVVTQMSEALGIPEINISHVVNHIAETQKTVTGKVYNKNKYLKEKREALLAWGEYLTKLIEESKAGMPLAA